MTAMLKAYLNSLKQLSFIFINPATPNDIYILHGVVTYLIMQYTLNLLRKLFDAHFSTPTEALYVELGIVPLKYIL